MDKIVTTYFAAVCSEAFTYKDTKYEPKPLHVSSNLLRGYTCPPGCGGCCPTFSLDYLPTEKHPYDLLTRSVQISGTTIPLYSDEQLSNQDSRCHNLDKATGRCGIHGAHPFSCDFELIRVIHRKEFATLTTMLFTRGWAMKLTKGGRGSLCDILPCNTETAMDVKRKLERLQEWALYFGVETKLLRVFEWIDDNLEHPEDAPPIII